MKTKFSFKEDYPVFMALIGFHIVDFLTMVTLGFWDLTGLELLFTAIPAALILLVYYLGRNASQWTPSAGTYPVK